MPTSPSSDPSPQELAALVAAIELAWPRPVVVVDDEAARRASPWRFSNRWWQPRRSPAVDRGRP
ncbi:MAG: hypothetical protein QOF60_1880 [Actinomycetota bacterium]|jgi:hypothetical protein|nr:hypothetical protein [Actinomycetota bacterium]